MQVPYDVEGRHSYSVFVSLQFQFRNVYFSLLVYLAYASRLEQLLSTQASALLSLKGTL